MRSTAWAMSCAPSVMPGSMPWLRDWAVLLLTMATVWAAEFINTALEAVVDLASPQQHPLARVGKDVGAAAVLIAAATSIVIGLLILGPPLWQRISAGMVR